MDENVEISTLDIEQDDQAMVDLDHFRIVWIAYFKAKSKRKADLRLRQLKNILGQEISVEKYEKYWKDPSLYQIIFSCNLNVEDFAQAIFQTLQLSGKIHHKWVTTTPQVFDGNRCDFSGYAANTDKLEMKMIDFHLFNFVRESSRPSEYEGFRRTVTE